MNASEKEFRREFLRFCDERVRIQIEPGAIKLDDPQKILQPIQGAKIAFDFTQFRFSPLVRGQTAPDFIHHHLGDLLPLQSKVE